MKKELEGFAAMASSSKGGRITIAEFAKILKLPVNPVLEELFALFDRVRTVVLLVSISHDAALNTLAQ